MGSDLQRYCKSASRAKIGRSSRYSTAIKSCVNRCRFCASITVANDQCDRIFRWCHWNILHGHRHDFNWGLPQAAKPKTNTQKKYQTSLSYIILFYERAGANPGEEANMHTITQNNGRYHQPQQPEKQQKRRQLTREFRQQRQIIERRIC